MKPAALHNLTLQRLLTILRMNLATVLPAGLLLLVALAAGALAWAGQRRAQRLERELQQARAERQALTQVLDAWQWRTDVRHRVTQWRPPRGAALADWAGTDDAPPLWQHFQANDTLTRSLRTAMDQHAPLSATALWRAGASGVRQAWSLRGEPLLDEQGRFAGYVGTAHELADPAEQRIAGLLQALPSPVLRVALPPPGQLGVLYETNPAADAWLHVGDPANLPAWPELLQRLPAGLRPLVDHAIAPTLHADGASGSAEGWELRVHRLPAMTPRGGHELLLFFTRQGGAAPAAGVGGEPTDEQESFSYTVSHDLRAPIRVVEGFTKIVKEDYGRLLDRIGNDHLDRVLGAAARMSSMIDSLLALSQLSSRPLARQPINLSQLVGYIVDDLRRQSPEREVQVDIEPGLHAQGDATLLRVALENLLGNAWKYTAKCRNAHIWFESSVHEGRTAFTVRDNGAGFDMRFADRLFGVFQRLHSANDFQGTGVGLASVRRIIRRHGGDIWAAAEVDRGAKFEFWLN